MAELWEQDAWELADGVRAGAVRSRDLVELSLERIEARDPELNSFCHLDPEGARARADQIDAAVAAGEDPGPFAGVPMGVKDGTDVAGMPTGHGSVFYGDDPADHDDVVPARLRAAGAVFLGKTTLPEFGSLNYTRSFATGVTRNPWDPRRTPGGSSGGSAAAVAGGLVPTATGGDGGGSVRIPSSYSGLYGFKGSFGRIPAGPGPYDTSLTSLNGPMVRSVRDAARYVDVCAAPTLVDPTSLPPPPRPYEEVATSEDPAALLRGKRATWSATLGFTICDPEVETVTRAAAEKLCAEAGIELVDVQVDIPRPGAAWGLWSSIDMAAEHLETVRDRLDEVTPFPRLGFQAILELRPEGLLKAVRRRHEMMTALARLFEEVDLLLTPTTATTAFAAEGPPPFEIAGQKTHTTGATPYTMPANMAGWPACSIPAGLIEGLPIGFQVMAPRHHDELMIAAGAVMELAHPWPKLAPLAASVAAEGT